jgi:hypothetical protein
MLNLYEQYYDDANCYICFKNRFVIAPEVNYLKDLEVDESKI